MSVFTVRIRWGARPFRFLTEPPWHSTVIVYIRRNWENEIFDRGRGDQNRTEPSVVGGLPARYPGGDGGVRELGEQRLLDHSGDHRHHRHHVLVGVDPDVGQ
jgi:hypothetical protein